ncbi:hypothetical protein [Fodinibius salsisoli]|uniref:Surface antigen n=1 Tax=Fodinibius salsisoli TaxID=2820877 RepID=A0ABT3PS54_9BACT|nr:hypothetical protein [Fodinibius salsisoli]MCW9708677.1 hypothetical protein [Fodinibius salsisoli]
MEFLSFNHHRVLRLLLWLGIAMVTQAGAVVHASHIHEETFITTTTNTNPFFKVADPDTIPGKAHPDSIPYRADRTLARTLLKAPAAVVHLAIQPLKWGINWNEEKQVISRISDFLLNEEKTAGFYPSFSIGGRTAFAAGFTYFNRDLFNGGHSFDFNTFYTNTQNYRLDINYKVPPAPRRRYQIDISGNLRKNNDQDIFLGGNSGPEDLEVDYQIESYNLKTEVGYLIRPNLLAKVTNGVIHTRVHNVAEQTETGEPLSNFVDPETYGFCTTNLLSSGLGVTLDHRKGLSENDNTNLISRVTTSYDFKQTKVRVYSGALYDAGISYSRSLNNTDFEYLTYYGDWQQFFSVPGLPLDRRLAFRARLQKRYPLGGASVPFYEQSILGDADNLRGYEQDRFRDLGSLLFTLEYRYPIWDTWDAVLFTDQGQVFSNYDQITFNRFHGSVGTGLRFMTASDFLFRVEIAFSKEEIRSLLKFTMNF